MGVICEKFGIWCDESDLRQYDIVVPLDVGTDAMTNKPFLYVGKDGEGAIIDIDPEKLEDAIDAGGVNLKTLNHLKDQNLEATGSALANRAFGEFIAHRNKGSLDHELPKLQDLENPSSLDLAVIKQSLLDVANDLSATAYERDPQKLGPWGADKRSAEIEAVEELRDIARNIQGTLDEITNFENLQHHAEELPNTVAKSKDLSLDQKDIITSNLKDGPAASQASPTTEPVQ